MFINNLKKISLVLVLILSLTACGGDDSSKREENETIMEDETYVIDESEEQFNKTEFVLKSIGEKEGDINQEVATPNESETKFFNSLAGGFFYSDFGDPEYITERQLAIQLLNDQTINLVEACVELYYDGVENYQNKILFFMDEIASSNTEFDQDFENILNEMVRYNTMIDYQSLIINNYYQIIDNNDEFNIRTAVINAEIFKLTNSLHDTLNEYINFLIITSEYIAGVMIEPSDKIGAEMMRADTDSFFRDSVTTEIAKVEIEYLRMTNIYAYIASADYYYNESTELDILKDLDVVNTNGNLNDIREDFVDKMDLVPDFLIDPLVELTVKPVKLSFPWIITTYAEEVDTKSKSLAIMSMISGLIDKSNAYNDESIENGGLTNDDLSEGDISAAMINFIMLQKKIKDGLVKKDEMEGAAIATFESHHDYLKSLSMQLVANPYIAIDREATEETSEVSELEQAKEVVNLALGIDDIENKIKAVKGELINSDQRNIMIDKFTAGSPNFLEVISINFMLNNGQGDIVYNGLISKFVNMLVKNEGKMSPEAFVTLSNLLKNDLAAVLGDKKNDFSTKIINGSMEEMVNKFTDWINKSGNRNGLKIDKNSLILLLNAAGFETEIEAETKQDGDGSIRDGMMIALEVDGVDLSDYVGTVYLLENSNVFVFYYNDGSISWIHSYNEYNNEYMIKDSYQFYENKQLEQKYTYIVKMAAAKDQISNYDYCIENTNVRPLSLALTNRVYTGVVEHYTKSGKESYYAEYDMEGNHIISESWDYFNENETLSDYDKLEKYNEDTRIAEKKSNESYYSDGTLSRGSYYENGLKTFSVNITYRNDNDGGINKIIATTYFVNGEKVNTEVTTNGVISRTVSYHDNGKTNQEIYYYEDGSISTNKIYDSSGKLISETHT
jgi:antitoxin component YwqK of YwqJK toxin-antitoxin module